MGIIYAGPYTCCGLPPAERALQVQMPHKYHGIFWHHDTMHSSSQSIHGRPEVARSRPARPLPSTGHFTGSGSGGSAESSGGGGHAGRIPDLTVPAFDVRNPKARSIYSAREARTTEQVRVFACVIFVRPRFSFFHFCGVCLFSRQLSVSSSPEIGSHASGTGQPAPRRRATPL